MRELENHLNLESVKGQCDFVEVKCPLKCGQSLQRRDLEKHQSSECAKRPFSCLYCDHKSSYEKVFDDHLPKCQRVPKVCPNKCSTDEIEQRFLQRYLQEKCPLEIISCGFSFAGCQVEVERKSMQKHLDEAKDEHLQFTAMACMILGAKVIDLTLAFAKFAPSPVFNPPPDIDEDCFSSAFYTHVGGYKMCLSIYANDGMIERVLMLVLLST